MLGSNPFGDNPMVIGVREDCLTFPIVHRILTRDRLLMSPKTLAENAQEKESNYAIICIIKIERMSISR